jgi:DNA-binding NtrC family response regulator
MTTVIRAGAQIAIVADPGEADVWARALECAGASVHIEAEVAGLRHSTAWTDVDLAVIGTPHAVAAELDEPGAPPFLAVRDALVAAELAALLRIGARDVLARPVTTAELVTACGRAIARGRVRSRGTVTELAALPVDPAIGAAIARTRLPVMLLGETGSGKSRLGRMIHEQLTPRAPFVEVNAGTLPGNLLVSELFGHERGAFTGAVGSKLGLVAAAHGGTLFLDEIGELPDDAQAQLLSFLDTGTYRPLGAVRAARSDARVFTATNRDLEAAVAAGRFREDLYYRLASIAVSLPPLRDQRERLPVLIADLLAQAAARAETPAPVIASDALGALIDYRWPGNVRQLRFVIERLVAVWPGQRISADAVRAVLGHTKPIAPVAAPASSDVYSLAEMERALVARAMRDARGNRTRAAALLGITPRGLYNKLRRLGGETAAC